ncbi:hypothetical protein LNJ03_11205 [Tenacibaculum dicentrarchi]|nr:hypothetical protein [Tenacibaculum dicentrarchi]
MQNIDFNTFHIAKLIVTKKIRNQQVYINSSLDSLVKKCTDIHELSDAMVLLKMVKKEVDGNNSKKEAELTRLNNLRYKDERVYNSVLFKKYLKISVFKIEQKVKENPTMTYLDVYKKFY